MTSTALQDGAAARIPPRRVEAARMAPLPIGSDGPHAQGQRRCDRAGRAAGFRQTGLGDHADGDRAGARRDTVRPPAHRRMDGPPLQADAVSHAAGGQLDGRRAEGRGADHLAVELPGAAEPGTDGRCDRRRRLHLPQTVGALPRHQPYAGRSDRTVYGPARDPRGAGRASGDRRAAGAAVRSHLLYGRRARRANRHGSGGQASDAGHAGARRQIAGVRGPHGESRRRGRPHRVGAFHQRRADLRGPGLRAGHAGYRRLPGGAHRGFRAAVLRRRPAAVAQLRAHHQRAPCRPPQGADARP